HRPAATAAMRRRPAPALPAPCCEQLRSAHREFRSAHLAAASNNRRCPQTRHARSPACDGGPFRHSFMVSLISQSTNRPYHCRRNPLVTTENRKISSILRRAKEKAGRLSKEQ